MLRRRPRAHALGTRQTDLLVKFHGINLPTLPAAARREKWQDFTPPAARRSRRYRGLILHRRFQTTDLVQKLQQARRDLALESAIAKLDKFHLLILDDITYVTKDQAETSVLFELISARYERRSLLITVNQPFGEWNTIFPDPAMTLAAVDRLVHHATIFEMNVESYRRRAAEQAKGPGRPAQRATPANIKPD